MKQYWKKALAALLMLGCAVAAQAQTQPVRVLVGFPAGGAPDAVARAFADALRRVESVNVVVENKSGAAGLLAIETLLASGRAQDTLAVIPSSAALTVPMINANARYDAHRDLLPLGALADYGFGVAAGPSIDATSLEHVKAWAARNPGSASYATPGVGTPQHLMGVELESLLSTPLLHVPYRGGANAMADLLGGQVPLLITTAQLLVPQHTAGKLKTLFVTTQERHPQMPEVPTANEVGMAALTVQDWFGLFANPQMSPEEAQRWRRRVANVVADPAYQATLVEMGYVVPDRDPAMLVDTMTDEAQRWKNRVGLARFN